MVDVNPDWSRSLDSFFGPGVSWPTKLALTLLALAGLWLVRRLLVGLVERNGVETERIYRWRKATAWTAGLLSFLCIGLIWFDQFRSLGTFLGLLSAGLAIALKDFISSLAAWLYIVIRAPFDAGDRVEIQGIRGDVIDIRLFKFSLIEIGNWVNADQSTGRVVHIPNSHVILHPLYNYSRGFHYIWHEIPILVTFESDWERAKEILLELVEEEAATFVEAARGTLERASRRYYLQFQHLTPIVYTRIADSGVLLTARHICPPRRRRGIESAIAERLLRRLADEPQIDLAYPTSRFYDHRREGKPGLVPSPTTPDAQG